MFCENCGSKVEDGARVCTNCGQSVFPTANPKRGPRVRKPVSGLSFVDKLWENANLKAIFLLAGCAIALLALIIFLCCFAFADAPDVLMG